MVLSELTGVTGDKHMKITIMEKTYCIVIPIEGHIADPGMGMERLLASLPPSTGAG